MSTPSFLEAAFGKSLQVTFPPVAVRLLNALLEPDPPFSVISEYLGMDPVLSGRILHIANSPAAGTGIKAASVDQAARILGLNELLKLAVSLGLQKRLQPLAPRDPEALYADWRLTVWSAIAAQVLADRLCPTFRRQAYLAAMLKDLPLFLAFCGQDLPPFLATDKMALLPSPAQTAAERDLWGKDHAELAHDIALSWAFPADLAEALRTHHQQAESLPPLNQCLIFATHWAEVLHNLHPDPAEMVAFELTLTTLLGSSAEEMAELRALCAGRFNAMLEQLGIPRSSARFRLHEHPLASIRDMHFLAQAAGNSRSPAGIAAALREHLRAFWGLSTWDAYLRLPGDAAGTLFRCRAGVLAPETRPSAAKTGAPPDWKTFPLSSTSADVGFLALPERDASAAETLPLFAHMLGMQIKNRAASPQRPAPPVPLTDLPLCLARVDASGIIQDASPALLSLAGLTALPPQTSLEALLRSRLGLPPCTLERLRGQTGRNRGFLVFLPQARQPGTPMYIALARNADGSSCLVLGETEPPEETRSTLQPSYQEALLAAIDERVCLIKDSGVIFWDFSGDASLAGKNIFAVSRPDSAFTAPWDPSLLAGLEEPLRLSVSFISGKDAGTPFVLSLSPLRDGGGKRFLLVLRTADPARGGQRRTDQRDSLTGLYSHSRFHLILEQEAEEARSNGSSLGILYCDLNNFQRINEQYGYLTGDALLTRIADCLTAVPGNEARFACRYEGDDFVLLVPRAEAATLEDIARDLDLRVRRISHEALSIRIGLALVLPGQAPVARIHLARDACGKAKITRAPFLWSG